MKKSDRKSIDTPQPWAFPHGSIESRAAAREMAELRPKVRIVESGVVTCEYECEGMDQDLTVNIANLGNNADPNHENENSRASGSEVKARQESSE